MRKQCFRPKGKAVNVPGRPTLTKVEILSARVFNGMLKSRICGYSKCRKSCTWSKQMLKTTLVIVNSENPRIGVIVQNIKH